MKKLLSILAAVGLTATASTAVVACTSTIKAKDVKVDTKKGTATFTKKVTIYKNTKVTKTDDGITIMSGTDNTGDKAKNYGYMVYQDKAKNIKVSTLSDEKNADKVVPVIMTADKSAIKDADIKDGATTKDVKKVNVTFTINIAAAIKAADGKATSLDWTLLLTSAKNNDDKSGKIESKTDIKINVPASTPAKKKATKDDATKNGTDTAAALAKLNLTVKLSDIDSNDKAKDHTKDSYQQIGETIIASAWTNKDFFQIKDIHDAMVAGSNIDRAGLKINDKVIDDDTTDIANVGDKLTVTGNVISYYHDADNKLQTVKTAFTLKITLA